MAHFYAIDQGMVAEAVLVALDALDVYAYGANGGAEIGTNPTALIVTQV